MPLAPFPDLALKPAYWGKEVDTVDSWRRHYRTLARRDENKPDLVKLTIPLDLVVYFGPPRVFISLPHGKRGLNCVG